ncbi:hypothetical protein HK101_009778 [Irineochytrium annulatum]|nr:hypothetical protein HK101_009778 [Irineochytrium annulatum]
MQFITIKLDQVSIVQTITFGKYHKVHVCNLKEFKVYGGLNPNNMIELLHSGLRNDTEPETFSLKHKANNVIFPCQYIKICPLLAHGPNFNFSIWYIELRGIAQREVVEKAYWDYVNVLSADFSSAEDLIQQAADRDLFQEYISGCPYKAVWQRLVSNSANNETPSMRGGHQMCIDVDASTIYLFGGWDGTKDLSDFWSYDLEKRRWTCISMDTRRLGGPGPRSCHKICFDPKMRQIYTMGRYVDPDHRPNVNLDGDFWRYDVASTQWTKISANTILDGGPELIYDHQMVVDSEAQVMYIFGGRTVGPDASTTNYSGLYAYFISTNRWRLIRGDTTQPENAIQLKSRIGHSMLLNPHTRELYIFAGQRGKDYLSDFYVYEIDFDVVHEVSRDYSKQGGPDAGFTQRATINHDLGEFYVLSGLQKDKNTTQESVKNSFWSYNIKRGKWTRVYHNENIGPEYWEKMKDREPVPRFAHQLVYDSNRRVQYLFGGNPGDPNNDNLRLDDFWELHLLRPSPADVLRRAKFQIRRQQFREMCQSGNVFQALQYLQSEVSEVVDHQDENESKAFRELTQWLFQWQGTVRDQDVWGANDDAGGAPSFPGANNAQQQPNTNGGNVPNPSSSAIGGLATGGSANLSVKPHSSILSGFNVSQDAFQTRTELYETLLEFFPESMREPKGNLVDLIDLLPPL